MSEKPKAPSIQIPRFSGKNEEAKNWLTIFKQIAKYYKWQASDALLYMSLNFDDTSLLWLEALSDAEKADLETLLKSFESRFVTGSSKMFLETAFSGLKIKSDENFDNYYLRLKSEGQKIEASNTRVMSHFLQTINPEARNFICASDISDESKVLEKARLFEQLSTKNKPEKEKVNNVADVPISNPNNFDYPTQDAMNYVSDRPRGNFRSSRGRNFRSRGTDRRQFSSGNYNNQNNNNYDRGSYNDKRYNSSQNYRFNNPRSRGAPRGRGNPRGGSFGRGKGVQQQTQDPKSSSPQSKSCYGCEGPHLMRQCPFNPKNKSPKCNFCGSTTHLFKKCPFKN